MEKTNKQLVQEQFGASAQAYATSEVHAKGRSLAKLIEILRPQPHWRILDVATAAGHTAHIFAPFVQHVVACDITFEMLGVAASMAREKGITNVSLLASDAEYLACAADQFDLVACRIAAHHFPNVSDFVRESARVLRPGGLLAVVDNVAPGSHLRGKKAEGQREAGRYVNAFEKLRDPSHVHCLSADEWQRQYFEAGFQITHQETITKAMDLDDWAARMEVPEIDLNRLRVMLLQAPEIVAEFFSPEINGSRITFHLTELILVGKLTS